VRLVRERLSSRFDVQRIVSFGSRGRGDAKPESDFDFLVIAYSDVPFVERQGLGMLALGPHEFPVDLLIYTPDEADAEAQVPGSALYWAGREGREVYAR
jgi:predicted nucleotidyltransferase